MSHNDIQPKKVKELEEIVFAFPENSENEHLPQTASEDEVVVDLLHKRTGMPYDELAAVANKNILQ